MSRADLIQAYITALPFAPVAVVATTGGRCRVAVGGEPAPGEKLKRQFYFKASHIELVLGAAGLTDSPVDQPPDAIAARLEKTARRLHAPYDLIPEIVVLKGEIETCIDHRDIYDTPVSVPLTLASKTDDLYLLGEPGRRLLQTIGLVNAVAAQTRRFQAIGVMHNGAPSQSRASDGASKWANNVNSLRVGIVNLNEVLEQIQSLQIS